jgi:hypothetical protein
MTTYSSIGKHFTAFICIASLALLLSGCGFFATECEAWAGWGVTVTVTDGQGAIVPDATVVFSVDGGAEEPAECLAEPGPCQEWLAGLEQSGKFKIKAASADGIKHAEATVVVTEDECHVISESVTLKLE